MNEKGFAHILIPFFIAIFALVTVISTKGFNIFNVSKMKDHLENRIETTGSISISPTAPPENKPKNNGRVIQSVFYKDQKIITDFGSSNVIKFKDWLVFPVLENTRYSIQAINIISGVKDTLISAQKTADDKIPEYLGASVMEFNGDIIAIYDEYGAPGFLYKIDGNDITKKNIVLLKDKPPFLGHYPELEKYGDSVFLTRGFGDACAGEVDYQQFNYDDFNYFGSVLRFGTQTEPKNLIVGYSTKLKAFLYSEYTDNFDEAVMCPKSDYYNLKSIDFSEKSKVLLGKEEFPTNIEHMRLDDATNRVYMISKKDLYYFDLLSMELHRVGNIVTKESSPGIIKILPDGGICITDENSLIDHTTGKTLKKNAPVCDYTSGYSNEERFKALQLPSTFTLETE